MPASPALPSAPPSASVSDSGRFTPGATDSLALAAIAALITAFRAQGDAAWPGYDLARRSLLVYLPDRWAVLLNAPHSVDGFSDYPGDWPGLGVPAELHTGSLEGLRGQLQFDWKLDGITTAAIAPTRGLDQGRRAAVGSGFTFIAHEAFHQFQRDAFQSLAGDQPEEEYPVLDSENTALASLEMRLLVDAVEAAARPDSARTRELTEEFLAVRKERWERAPEVIPRFERPQEIMEGSAQYVEVRSVGLIGDLCRDPLRSSDPALACDVFNGVTQELYLLADFADRLSDGVIDPVDMPRNRVYPTGAALGLLLDLFGVEWKTRVSDAANSPGLAEILREGIRWRPGEGDSLLARAKRHYTYQSIRAECDRRIQAYEAEYQDGVDNLRSAPGIHLSIETSILNLSRSRSCEGRRLVLGHPTRSFSRRCHVYTLKHVGTDDLFVEIRESPIIEEADAGGTARRVDFVAPDIRTAELDGRAVDLAAAGGFPFRRLRLAGSTFQIRYDGPGTLEVSPERIVARLIPPLPPVGIPR